MRRDRNWSNQRVYLLVSSRKGRKIQNRLIVIRSLIPMSRMQILLRKRNYQSWILTRVRRMKKEEILSKGHWKSLDNDSINYKMYWKKWNIRTNSVRLIKAIFMIRHKIRIKYKTRSSLRYLVRKSKTNMKIYMDYRDRTKW